MPKGKQYRKAVGHPLMDCPTIIHKTLREDPVVLSEQFAYNLAQQIFKGKAPREVVSDFESTLSRIVQRSTETLKRQNTLIEGAKELLQKYGRSFKSASKGRSTEFLDLYSELCRTTKQVLIRPPMKPKYSQK